MDFGMLSTASIAPEDNNCSTSTVMKARKQTDKDGGISRANVLLALFVIVLSTILPISSIVYVHQLKTGCMREFSQLRAEFGSTKEKQRDDNTNIVNPSIEEIQMAMFNRAEEFDKELNKLKSLFSNQTEAIAFDIEQLKKIHGKNLTSPQSEVKQSENGGFNNAEQLLAEIRDWNMTYLRHMGDLQDDIAECRNLQLNETRKREESLHLIGQSIKNHTATFESWLTTSNDTYYSKFQFVSRQIEELQNADFAKTADMDEGLLAIKSLCLNRTDAVTSDLEQLKRVDSENLVLLENKIEERRTGESNQTANINKRMKDIRAEFTNQLGNLTEQLFESEKDTAEEIERLDRRLAHIQNSYSNLDNSTQNKIDHLNTSQYTVKSQLVRLQSKIDQLPTQHQIEQLNTTQSTMMSTVENQQRLTSSLNSTMQSVQNTINYLTAVSKIYTTVNGWRRFGSFPYKKFAGTVTEQAASSTCSSHGGRLAAKILRDADAVRTMIRNGDVGPQAMWIGLNDKSTEGEWRSSDGGSMNPAGTSWLPGEPNNSGNEDCASAVPNGNILMLNDKSCSTSYAFLCEVDITQT